MFADVVALEAFDVLTILNTICGFTCVTFFSSVSEIASHRDPEKPLMFLFVLHTFRHKYRKC